MRLPLRAMQPLSIQTPDGAWHQSLVMDFTEGSDLLIGSPLEGGRAVALEPGTPVEVEFPLPDGIRRFTAVVRDPEAGPAGVCLSWPQILERIQRRDHVRVEVSLAAEVRALRGPSRGVLRGSTADLSAGGARIRLSSAVDEGTEVEVTLDLPGAGWQTTRGRVLRGGELHPAFGELDRWVAVEFTAIGEALRRDITRVVFEVQREQIRKGGE